MKRAEGGTPRACPDSYFVAHVEISVSEVGTDLKFGPILSENQKF